MNDQKNTNPKYGSRKFVLAFFASMVASIALFTLNDFEAGDWVTSQSIILSLYGAANVAQRKITKE